MGLSPSMKKLGALSSLLMAATTAAVAGQATQGTVIYSNGTSGQVPLVCAPTGDGVTCTLQVQVAGSPLPITGAPTPIPYPTGSGGVLKVQPTNVPTLGVMVQNTPSVSVVNTVTVTCSSGCPTPIPFPSVQTVTWPSALPITGAFPTPIPLPTQPYQVVPGTAATPATQATVAATTAPVQIFAGSASLNGFTLCNSSTSDAYFNLGTTATLGAPFWQHYPGVTVTTTTTENCFTMLGVGVYRGPIWGIWTTANGYAVFTWW